MATATTNVHLYKQGTWDNEVKPRSIAFVEKMVHGAETNIKVANYSTLKPILAKWLLSDDRGRRRKYYATKEEKGWKIDAAQIQQYPKFFEQALKAFFLSSEQELFNQKKNAPKHTLSKYLSFNRWTAHEVDQVFDHRAVGSLAKLTTMKIKKKQYTASQDALGALRDVAHDAGFVIQDTPGVARYLIQVMQKNKGGAFGAMLDTFNGKGKNEGNKIRLTQHLIDLHSRTLKTRFFGDTGHTSDDDHERSYTEKYMSKKQFIAPLSAIASAARSEKSLSRDQLQQLNKSAPDVVSGEEASGEEEASEKLEKWRRSRNVIKGPMNQINVPADGGEEASDSGCSP